MKNVGLFMAVTGALACASAGVQASLSNYATLTFEAVNTSYFSMGGGFDPATGAYLTSHNGIIFSSIQPATPAEPGIDNAWDFFGNQGVHETVGTPVTILNADDPQNVTLDFSGWYVFWNNIPINMSAGAWGVGFSNGVANMVCGNTCANGDTYTLEYTATVPDDGSTNFGNVQYALHLEGTIAVTGHLPSNAVFNFDTETSYFEMPSQNGIVTTPIGSNNGIILGKTQPATPETPDIDNPWDFLGVNGVSETIDTPVTVINEDDPSNASLDFSGWAVNWGGAEIPLGTGAWTEGTADGVANLHCTDACEEGDTYTLDYSATVQAGDFANAQYRLHLEGTIGVAGPPPTPPVTNPDSVKTKPNDSVLIDVLKNDSSPDGLLDCTSVAVVTNPVNGTATVDTDAGSADCGSITYLPNVDFKGTDTFEYTVASDLGATSDPTLVTVKVKKGGGGSSSSGCTMSTNNSPYQGEWWLLAGFVAWLGWKQHNQRNRKMH
jgi:hypothetical protein